MLQPNTIPFSSGWSVISGISINRSIELFGRYDILAVFFLPATFCHFLPLLSVTIFERVLLLASFCFPFLPFLSVTIFSEILEKVVTFDDF